MYRRFSRRLSWHVLKNENEVNTRWLSEPSCMFKTQLKFLKSRRNFDNSHLKTPIMVPGSWDTWRLHCKAHSGRGFCLGAILGTTFEELFCAHLPAISRPPSTFAESHFWLQAKFWAEMRRRQHRQQHQQHLFRLGHPNQNKKIASTIFDKKNCSLILF